MYIHPLAIKKVEKKAKRKGYSNIKTILSDRDTVLDATSVDAVLLFDIIHILSEPDKISQELHRILKLDGESSLTIHHIDEKEATAKVEQTELLKFYSKGKYTHSFSKI